MRAYIGVFVILCVQGGPISGNEWFSSYLDTAKYLGCYSTYGLDRRYAHLIYYNFSAKKCSRLCSGMDARYVGIESINSTCYCGNDLATKMKKDDDSHCKPCEKSFDGDWQCGGIFKMSLYDLASEESAVTFGAEPVLLLAGHGGIYMFNISSQNMRTVLKTEHEIDAVGYHLRLQEGYVSVMGEFYRFPLFEDEILDWQNATEIPHTWTRCPIFAVDWVHDRIYYPDCNDLHAIMAYDLHHNMQDTLVFVPGGAWAWDMVVDPYRGLIFWTTGAAMWSCRLDGRNLRKIIPAFPVNLVSSLFLDYATEAIYFFGPDKKNKSLSKFLHTDYDGHITSTRLYANSEAPYHEEIQTFKTFGTFNSEMYTMVENKSVVFEYKSTTFDKSAYFFITKFTLDNKLKVSRLKVIHSNLQKPVKTDACTDRGCEHLCVLEGSAAVCYCASEYRLGTDNKSCNYNVQYDGKESVPFMIAEYTTYVLVILLAAGVLMCICDKLWSQIHPIVVRLSPGSGSRASSGTIQHRSDHLI